jgi:hypothetical protein
MLKSGRVRWAHMGEKRSAYIVFVRKPEKQCLKASLLSFPNTAYSEWM